MTDAWFVDCVCGHPSANHYAHTGPCYDPDDGCSYYLPDTGERESEAAGGRLPDLYKGTYAKPEGVYAKRYKEETA